MTQPPAPPPPAAPHRGPVQPAPPAGPPALPNVGAAVETVWPSATCPARTRSYVAALATGVVAAAVLPGARLGAGLVVVGLLVVASVLLARPGARRRRDDIALGALAVALVTVAAGRDAEWVAVLCLAAAFGLGSLVLGRARTWTGLLLSTMTVPLAGLRGLPWLVRGLVPVRRLASRRFWPVARGVAIGALLVLVFGSLFAWADAAFAELAGAVVPDVRLGEVPARAVVVAAVAGLVLAASFLAVAPPAWTAVTPPPGRAARRAEWFIPIAALDALFVAFVLLQLSALFGDRDYVARTAGLTFAEYAREGFGQLLVVTLLTLVVIAVAARRAPRERRSDVLAVKALLGSLCVLALVVAASALRRLDLYESAFGATQARLLAAAIEAEVAVVLLLVLVAGVRWSAEWLPRAVAASAALVLLGLAVVDADALVARRNVERFAETGRIDTAYLSRLSADAVPALDRLPEPQRSCALRRIAAGLAEDEGGWASANLGRARARSILADRPVQPCADPRSASVPE